MKPADAGDEKLGTDALCGDELVDEDLEGVTGGDGSSKWTKTPAIHWTYTLGEQPPVEPDKIGYH